MLLFFKLKKNPRCSQNFNVLLIHLRLEFHFRDIWVGGGGREKSESKWEVLCKK